ncbi:MULTISPECIES: Fpg/Nei family DNA glycosylase [unclassified Paenibacillus]|uniref:Fpg/Nei family DNA glycosylase n=1 Tax=unclassified Paenibacillus TaxID=185978 RepID=UPI001C128E8D|nr:MULTISPECIES: DNA-formamidopyrimidine glycosylase family protein [unclassified Paenibacillus]MBU5443148.1 endonuclease VIII [Paenibacillus sp. MSJ-34]CAH0121160.1 Formamidopyrimidine-DNA glycosylase [Paenibacillus sp. CECT 9249]
MPELPEMEIYKKLLSDRIVGKTITNATVNRAKSVNIDARQFESELVGKQILFVERRAKYLIFHLDNGRRLLLHLMLGGLMFYGTPDEKPDRTTQVEISFGDATLYFIGLRLGYLHLLSVNDTDEALSDLGPEPFDRRMTADKFSQLCRNKRGTLKSALVNQSFIAGIGNCYSDEIAFGASLLPSAKLQDLEPPAIERLYRSMHSILREAVESGGYVEMPLTADDALTGGYNARLKVYDREGEACPRCGTAIVRTEIASRKAFLCPGCQHAK